MSYDRKFCLSISDTAHDVESTSCSSSVTFDDNNESDRLPNRQFGSVPEHRSFGYNYAGDYSRLHFRDADFRIPENSIFSSRSRISHQSTQTNQPTHQKKPIQKDKNKGQGNQGFKNKPDNKPFPKSKDTTSKPTGQKPKISGRSKGSHDDSSSFQESHTNKSEIKGKKKTEFSKVKRSQFHSRNSLTFEDFIRASRPSGKKIYTEYSPITYSPYTFSTFAYNNASSLNSGYRAESRTYLKRSTPEMFEDLDEQDKKVVVEFCHLLEKSKQLFNGLRDLPQYGHRQWQGYFGRTFDIYTKLWKFQQQHRSILDRKYGLKRWQIGEIASKIGQLYYHYYLRTSETNYLNEAYSFYAAIRGRSYYSKAAKEDRCDLMVKKLRYYARFIVVCLLLKKLKLVRDLILELERQVSDYSKAYDPDDHLEWNVVLDEIKSFIKAEAIVAVIHADSNSIVLCHRLTPLTTPPVERSAVMNLSLQEILIVGSCCDQVKFSELTMDMFRMLQTLEREPHDDFNHIYDASPVGHPGRNFGGMPSTKGGYGDTNGERSTKLENPHKYLLYKPSLSQLLVFLSSGFKELPSNGALLLYLSGDGCFSHNKHPEDMAYDLGGIKTNSRHDTDFGRRTIHQKESHCLYPGDLYPFTRKPLFLIVDSDNSHVFQHVPRYFGQPIVVLMSPQELPTHLQAGQHTGGSLFTLFLNSPLTGLCLSCNLTQVPIHHWERCQSYIDRFNAEASKLFSRTRVDMSYVQFFGDDFLRLLLVRYVFCELVLRLHRGFRTRHMLPKCYPPLPEEDLLNNPTLQGLIMDLAAHLDLMTHFHDMPE